MLLENTPYSQDGRVQREARALRDAGYAVTVICPRGRGESFRMDFDGVLAYQYPSHSFPNGFLGYVLEYGYAIAAMVVLSVYALIRPGFDVLHAHNPPDFLVAIAAVYKLLGKRFIFDHHDLTPEMFRARFGADGHRVIYAILVLFERLTCRLADQIIATSESIKQLESERSGVSVDKITVVRNGPEARHFADVDPHPSLRGVGKTVIGFVGEMGPLDGVDSLLRALHALKVKLKRDDWLAVLVGDGESFISLQQLAQELGIAPDVRFVGRVPFADVVPYIRAMDVCAIPDPCNDYTRRCTLIKTMEYMAQGKAIVAFDLTETRFSAQQAAIYVGDNDEDSFARALAQLMDDPARREEMGRWGRRRAESELAWRHSIPRLLSAYARVTGTMRRLGPFRPLGPVGPSQM
jgi:glycosyltransferase involved in cell wall biosynthesis